MRAKLSDTELLEIWKLSCEMARGKFPSRIPWLVKGCETVESALGKLDVAIAARARGRTRSYLTHTDMIRKHRAVLEKLKANNDIIPSGDHE